MSHFIFYAVIFGIVVTSSNVGYGQTTNTTPTEIVINSNDFQTIYNVLINRPIKDIKEIEPAIIILQKSYNEAVEKLKNK